MRRLYAPLLSLVVALAFAPVAHAQHDVPVWYLDYEVTIKTNHTATTMTFGDQPTSTTWTFERVFSASAKLDMRNEGSVISTTLAAMADPDKLKNMTQAESMKYSQDMLSAMQYTANWMPGPLDVGDGQDAMMNHITSVSVPVRLSYQCTTTGKNLVNEMGDKYDFESTESVLSAEGKLYVGEQYQFEINTQSKKYWLVLPYTGQDMDPNAGQIKWESVEKTRPAGGDTWDEKRSTRETEVDWLPGNLKVNKTGQSTMGDAPLIEGAVTGPDKITGEKTFNASFPVAQNTVPATITFKYTLSSTPPAKKK